MNTWALVALHPLAITEGAPSHTAVPIVTETGAWIGTGTADTVAVTTTGIATATVSATIGPVTETADTIKGHTTGIARGIPIREMIGVTVGAHLQRGAMLAEGTVLIVGGGATAPVLPDQAVPPGLPQGTIPRLRTVIVDGNWMKASLEFARSRWFKNSLGRCTRSRQGEDVRVRWLKKAGMQVHVLQAQVSSSPLHVSSFCCVASIP